MYSITTAWLQHAYSMVTAWRQHTTSIPTAWEEFWTVNFQQNHILQHDMTPRPDNIAAASIEDVQELNVLINSAYRGDSSRQGWTTEADLLDGARCDEALLTEALADPKTTFLKYVEDDRLLGCVRLDKHGDKLYLGMLTVSPRTQGKGVGKALLAAAEAKASALRCLTVYMTVISVRTELIEWYERHGYKRTGEKKPFITEDARFGIAKMPLEFVVLEKKVKSQAQTGETSVYFADYYKTISDTDLLHILDNPGDYQPSAVEAAQQEFRNRSLSDIDIQNARLSLADAQAQKEKGKEKIKAVETRIKTAGHELIDTINPVSSRPRSTDTIITIIVLVFAAIFLYRVFSDPMLHWAVLLDIDRYPMFTIVYFVPLVLLPIGTFAFWKRKRSGWILLMIHLSFSAVGMLWSLVQAAVWRPSGFGNLDNLFPRPSLVPLFMALVFFIGTIVVMCKPGIREIYSIGKQKAALTIGLAGAATFILLWMGP